MESDPMKLKVHLVTGTDTAEFRLLSEALGRSSVVGLDAEWKPVRRSFPTVSVLQIACGDWGVFVLDLLSIPLSSLSEPLRELLLCPDILKLGFGFKQDLTYLSSTFCSHGGFDKVEPYLDIRSVYNHLHHSKKHEPKQSKSLSTICAEVLGFSLSKELQCSDWSHRPLTEEQIRYAAMDAHCLLDIFKLFQEKVVKEGDLILETIVFSNRDASLGLKELFRSHDTSDKVLRAHFCEALAIVEATTCSDVARMIPLAGAFIQKTSYWVTIPMDEVLLKVVKKYGDRILLKELDKKPKSSKKKGKKHSLLNGTRKENHFEKFDELQGTPPWDPLEGGNGYPKFLCDVMVEGLAKHLRCVGIDAAIPYSKKPEPRMLIEQAQKEKRVILTRDAKLQRHDYLMKNQIYRVKSLLKNEQLLECPPSCGFHCCCPNLLPPTRAVVGASAGSLVAVSLLLHHRYWRCCCITAAIALLLSQQLSRCCHHSHCHQLHYCCYHSYCHAAAIRATVTRAISASITKAFCLTFHFHLGMG